MHRNHLHSNKFDLCRICMLEPESNRNVNFINIFMPTHGKFEVHKEMAELLGVTINAHDIKPKIICDNCYKSLYSWYEMKKKAKETEIVVDYIAKKEYGRIASTSIASTSIASTSIAPTPIAPTPTASTSKSVNTSRMLRNNERSTQETTFNHSQLISKRSNTNLNCCSTSYYQQGNSSRSLVTNHSNSAFIENDSDDSSCVETPLKVAPVIIISDDEDDEFVNNDVEIEYSDENVFVHVVANEATTDSGADENEFINVEDGKMYYCSICQKQNILDHDCSQHNKSFFTCLVPNCNILARSLTDFTPHYQLHIGMPSSAVMCRRCYKEIDRSNNGGCTMLRCHTLNPFKCYTCCVSFESIQKFAFHKLKVHNSRLMNSYGDYLCLHCEETSPDLSYIVEHTRHCFENQQNNLTVNSRRLKRPTVKGTELLPVQQKTVRKRRAKKKLPCTSKCILFTCLKPSCNFIFQTFAVFKQHYREHFEIGNDELVCWQCCTPFPNIRSLRAHQVKNNCRTPGMIKCYQCREKFDDIQSFSIHKLTFHGGDLVSSRIRKNNKNILCSLCNKEVNLYYLRGHLAKCQKKKKNSF